MADNQKLTMEDVPWDEYDTWDLNETEAYLVKHPEVRQLAYSRDMERMHARRNGDIPVEVNPGTSMD